MSNRKINYATKSSFREDVEELLSEDKDLLIEELWKVINENYELGIARAHKNFADNSPFFPWHLRPDLGEP